MLYLTSMKKVSNLSLPFYYSPVPAGFPSPADDFIDVNLDLNDYLVKHPASTFFVRCSGDSMSDAGIRNGDILVVDRSLTAYDGCIVIAVIEGELLLKRLKMHEGHIFLRSESTACKEIEMSEERFEVWGVVTSVIHKVR